VGDSTYARRSFKRGYAAGFLDLAFIYFCWLSYMVYDICDYIRMYNCTYIYTFFFTQSHICIECKMYIIIGFWFQMYITIKMIYLHIDICIQVYQYLCTHINYTHGVYVCMYIYMHKSKYICANMSVFLHM
jgi:hypothetical protein